MNVLRTSGDGTVALDWTGSDATTSITDFAIDGTSQGISTSGSFPYADGTHTISAIATDLQVPRHLLVLPNGDILVAEGKGGGKAPKLKPKDYIAGMIQSRGTTSVKSGNRLTLLRDGDGDGTYEQQGVFAKNLNAPLMSCSDWASTFTGSAPWPSAVIVANKN